MFESFLFCFVSFRFVSFFFVLFFFVLFVLFCFVLFCFVLFCFVLFCAVLFLYRFDMNCLHDALCDMLSRFPQTHKEIVHDNPVNSFQNVHDNPVNSFQKRGGNFLPRRVTFTN